MATPRKPKHLHEKTGRKEKFSRDEILSWEKEFIEKSAQGMSEREFLGSKGCYRTYFDERIARDIPELSDIKEKGRAAREGYYRQLIVAGSVGKIKGFQLGGFIWLTKHILGWFDQPGTELDVSLGAGGSKLTFKSRFAEDKE